MSAVHISCSKIAESICPRDNIGRHEGDIVETELEAELYGFMGNIFARETGSSDAASAKFRSLVSQASHSSCVGSSMGKIML